jgi:HD-like signal output (HDOD) protein
MTSRELLKKFNNLKILPPVAIKLNALIDDPNSNSTDFEAVIKMDPVLVVRLLRLVNSPYYGLREKVSRISRAIVFIGMRDLRNMVVVEAMKDIFQTNNNEEFFSRPQLWLHSSIVGICSQMLSERIMKKRGEDAFLCGILHDIGMIVEDRVAHDLFIKACQAYKPNNKPFINYEKDIIGTNHCEVGYLLSKEWKLPDEVQDGIKYHHNLEKDISPTSVPAIIQFSEYIVSRMNYAAIPTMKPDLSPHLSIFLKENIGNFKALLKDLPNEISKAKELYTSEQE